MTDLKTQLRAYYESTTRPTDIDAIAIEPGTVVVGPVPDAARRRSAMSTEHSTTTRSWFHGSRAALAALVATVAVIVGVVLATNDSGSDAAADRSPGAVLFAFQDAYNAGNVDRILDQFAPDAAITRYPNLITNATGTDQIEALFTSETDNGAQYQFSDVAVEGSTITFRHRWTAGICTTAQGHRMVVENGLIQSWDWPTTNARC